tara:strand:+ start:512 stop:712 length:201 start_codon:yes stop_codon:yes gene_type:complete
MKRRHKINNAKFSIRLCNIAHTYGFKTVGGMLDALTKAKPHAKWCYGTNPIRGARLIDELNNYINE